MARLTLGERIRRLREGKAWTLHRMRVESGLGIGALSEIERDLRQPSIESLGRIARALEVRVSLLLGESESSSGARLTKVGTSARTEHAKG